MRLAFHRQMAPRGAHPSTASFLKAPPPVHSQSTNLISYWATRFRNSNTNLIQNKLKTNISHSAKSPSDKSSHPNSTRVLTKIPSNTNTYKSLSTAPEFKTSPNLSTLEFHTVLRKKSNRAKKYTLSPKSYYNKTLPTNSKESSQSVFTQFSKFIEEDEPIANMESTSQSPVNQVSPEKDVTMKTTPDSTPMTPEEEKALLEEFDVSAQEPPSKLHKTWGGPPDPTSPTQTSPTVHLTQQHGNPTPPAPPAPSTPSPSSIPSPPVLPTGTNIGMFTATQHQPEGSTNDIRKAPSIAQQNAISNRIPVSRVEKTIMTCRFKLLIKGHSCNLPHLAKQVVKLYRSADSSLHILPFHGVSENNKVLDTEDNLPHDEEEIKTWVVKSQVIKDRLHFTMKFSSIKTIPALSKRVFPWMKANKSFVQMDKIDSEIISCLGLFEGFHPDFRNRDIFKQYIESHIKKYNPAITQEISVYPRAVFAGAGLNKVESRAVVIEVAEKMADATLQALTHSFHDEYASVTFVPFTKTDETYSDILRHVLIQQNTMLHNTKRKILHGLKNIDETFTMLDGTVMSIRQWLLSAKSDKTSSETSLIQHVDYTTKRSVSIIFDTGFEEILNSLLREIDQELVKYFPEDILVKVYEEKQAYTKRNPNERTFTESEKQWAEHIKRKYAVNPQQSDQNDLLTPPNKNRKVLYHGPSEAPTQIQENTFDPPPNSSEASLVERLSKLETQAKELNSSQTQFIEQTIQKSMQATEAKLVVKTNERYEELSQKMKILEENTSNTFKLLNTNITTLSSNVDRLCDKLLSPASTTKDRVDSEGGKGQ